MMSTVIVSTATLVWFFLDSIPTASIMVFVMSMMIMCFLSRFIVH